MFQRLSILFLVFALACSSGSEGGDEVSEAQEAPKASSESAPTPAASSDRSTCDMLTTADVAAAFGVDPSVVTEKPGEAANYSSNVEDCIWSFDDQGITTSVKVYWRNRSEKAKLENMMSKIISNYLTVGETIGSKTIAHEPASFGSTGEGALSGIYGNKFSRERIYSWRQGEERLYRLGVTHTLSGDGASLSDPSPEHIEKLVISATD